MKIAVILLDYLRHDFTKQALRSISNGGYPFDLFTIQEKGIAKATNKGLDLTMNYDGVVICGNDIEMPDNWLVTMVDYCSAITDTGMCGIHCVEGQGNRQTINGKEVNVTGTAFGNVLIPRKALDTVGYFNEDYDPYGIQDSDYGYRLIKTGFINYYIPNLTSVHIGHDVGQQSDYRKMKDEGLAKAGEKWTYWSNHYDTTNNYKL